MLGKYYVDIAETKGKSITLTTHLFTWKVDAERFFKRSKKKDNEERYTYNVERWH